MRATFITTALKMERNWKTYKKPLGIATRATKMYDRRGYNPEKAASFFATH
jgi:integrase/recombinase XerD